MTSNPPLGPLRSIVQELQSSGLQPTLGGSGLLRAHGLVEAVHDWDVLVDVDRLGVEAILQAAGFSYADGRAAAGGRYASSARLLIEIDGEGVDLIVEFAIWPDGVSPDSRPVRIPSLPAGTWNGIPLGSLEAWLVAYRLMRRPGKPDRIHEHLAVCGVNRDHLARMLAEPLPDAIKTELEQLHHA